MIYFDSSALVKQYIEEIGSNKVNALLKETETIVTSRLAYPEILSAIIRRHKAGDIKTNDFERIKKQFKADWKSFTIIEIHKEIIALIDSIIEKHALRGADSIHLSTALWLRHTAGGEVLFVAADVELLQAAKKEKMQTVTRRIDRAHAHRFERLQNKPNQGEHTCILTAKPRSLKKPTGNQGR